MSITVAWYDEAKTAIHLYFSPEWNWEEYHKAIVEAYQVMSTTPHAVDLLFDVTNSPVNGLFCSGYMEHLRSALQLLPPNTGVIAFTGASSSPAQLMASLFLASTQTRQRTFVFDAAHQAYTAFVRTKLQS